MYQVLFHLPGFLPLIGGMPVYGYGVMLVIGFFAAIYVARFLAVHSRMDPEIFINAGLIALLAGVAGARLSHVLETWPDYTRSSVTVATANADTLLPQPVKAEKEADYTLYGPNRTVLGRYHLAQDAPIGFSIQQGRLVAVAGAQPIPLPAGEGRWERAVSVWENLFNAVNIRSGGLTFYGGLLLATPCTIAYGLMKKVNVRVGMDIVAPCVMIGLGFGRVGCYLNGCCYGAQADPRQVPWAQTIGTFPYYSNPYRDEVEKHKIDVPEKLRVPTTDGGWVPMPPEDLRHHLSVDQPKLEQLMAEQHSLPLHPAQLYSTITAWLIAAVLIACFTLPHVPGRIFALMLLLEAPTRYILEMLREEPAVAGKGTRYLSFLPPQSFSMVLSVGLFILGIVLWFAFRGPKTIPGEPDPGGSPGLTPVPA